MYYTVLWGIDRIKLLLPRSAPDKNSVMLKIANMLKIEFKGRLMFTKNPPRFLNKKMSFLTKNPNFAV